MLLQKMYSLRGYIVSASLMQCLIFSTDSFALPTLVLPSSEWSLISIPVDSGSGASIGTVAELFADDLPAGTYGQPGGWLLYQLDATSNSYRQVALGDTMQANTGYWIIQLSGEPVTLDIPVSPGASMGQSLPGCPVGKLCSRKLLVGKESGQWNLVGVSSSNSVNFADTRFQADNTPCAVGCTPAQAMSASLIGATSYRYRGGQYEAISASSVLDPWDGLWLRVLPGAPATLNWLLPVGDSDTLMSSCTTSGGKANDSGLKTWCWEDVPLPEYGGKTATFSDGELGIDSECNENQISRVGQELRFYLELNSPPQDWCSNLYNLRAELLTRPWKVNNPIGTEEWFGWTYRFGDNYKPDTTNPWSFFQAHHGDNGSPPIALVIAPSTLYGAENGEIVVVNHANKMATDRTRTGVVTKAGMSLDVVVHVIHNLNEKGLLQVWINGKMVYNKQVSTVYDVAPLGGNAKFGIYKWPWREASGVQSSLDQGIDHLETYMGPLRIITRKPWDENYGEDSFCEVDPV